MQFLHKVFRISRKVLLAFSLAIGVGIWGLNSTASAAIVFDNQFDSTWDVDNDNDGIFESVTSTYTPSLVNAKFRQTGQTQIWNVSILQPQPWSLGGVIFTGGANTTGEMTTEISTLLGYIYTYDWGVSRLGTLGTPTVITATAFDGSGTGGSVLGSGTLDNGNPSPQVGSFTFAGTGGVVTLSNRVTFVGTNGSTDAQVDFVTVSAEAIPEPGTLAVALLGGVGLLAISRKRRLKTQSKLP